MKNYPVCNELMTRIKKINYNLSQWSIARVFDRLHGVVTGSVVSYQQRSPPGVASVAAGGMQHIAVEQQCVTCDRNSLSNN